MIFGCCVVLIVEETRRRRSGEEELYSSSHEDQNVDNDRQEENEESINLGIMQQSYTTYYMNHQHTATIQPKQYDFRAFLY